MIRAEILEKTISIELKNVELSKALKAISNKAGFDYSYNAEVIKEAIYISLKADKLSVRAVLYMALENTGLTFKESKGTILFYKKKT